MSSQRHIPATSPRTTTVFEETMASLDDADRLTANTADGATRADSGSLTQLQYDLALGTGVATLVTAAVNYSVNGYSALRAANAATRSARANERIAIIQEATLKMQQEQAAKDDQESNTEREDASGPLSKRYAGITRSNSSGRSPKVTHHLEAGYSRSGREHAKPINRLPPATTSVLTANSLSRLTSLGFTEAQSDDSERRRQKTQPNREAKVKLSTIFPPNRTIDVQHLAKPYREEQASPSRLPQTQHGSDIKDQGPTKPQDLPPTNLRSIDLHQQESKHQNTSHKDYLRSQSSGEDATNRLPPTPKLIKLQSQPTEASSASTLSAWGQKPEDQSLKTVSSTSDPLLNTISATSDEPVSPSRNTYQEGFLPPPVSDPKPQAASSSAQNAPRQRIEEAAVPSSLTQEDAWILI